jgi:enoyl-CoA hydratase/carnithine racemase
VALADYADKFQTIRFHREDGILQMTLHTDGGPLRWGRLPHGELEQAFLDVARDRENQVIIITGTGDEFSGPAPKAAENIAAHRQTPDEWGVLGWESKNLLTNLLAIDAPMISAINGPALRHAEIPVLCDIVLAAETATFQDSAHFTGGLVPGDGMHVVFPMVMGMNRGRYFLFSGQIVDAHQALEYGIVNEVLSGEELLPRAWEHARQIMSQPELNRRYTRVLVTEMLRRQMNDLLAYGLALEGLALIGESGKDRS